MKSVNPKQDDTARKLLPPEKDTNKRGFWWTVLKIIGIAIIIICLVFLASTAYKFLKTKKSGEELNALDPIPFEKGSAGSINPKLPIQDQIDLLPYDEKFKFPREKLKFGPRLGGGSFGVVLKAEAKGLKPEKDSTTVAVKMLYPNADCFDVKALHSELRLMMYLGHHKNVISLLGYCPGNIDKDLYVIVEYCKYGNLLDLVQKIRNFIDQTDRKTDQIYYRYRADDGDFVIDNKELIRWSMQIANGMDFLASRKVVHRDLALRNILLDEDRVVKIADFGLSRKTDIYKSRSGVFPPKWSAIESLRYNLFTQKSDTWSVGIVMWELFSLGAEPYPGVQNHTLGEKLKAGYRLGKPKYATDQMYDIMKSCWRKEPESRPTFRDLGNSLQEMLEKRVISDSVDDSLFNGLKSSCSINIGAAEVSRLGF